MGTTRTIYKVARTIAVVLIALIVVAFLAVYVVLSNPKMQEYVKNVAVKEASAFLGAKVEVGSLKLALFNEARLDDVKVYTPTGELCTSIQTVGAGINLWRLITEQKIEISYAELIGMDARIWQQEKDAPLNIDFIIKAFQPKQKNKPPTKFDVKLHNVVIRRCQAAFDRRWCERLADTSKIDFNHLRANDIKADIYLPRIANDDFDIDLRRLSLNVDSLLFIDKLQLKTHITQKSISVKDLVVELPNTTISPADFTLNFNGFSDIMNAVKSGRHSLVLVDNPVTLSDFSGFLPTLGNINDTFNLTINAIGNLENLSLKNFAIASKPLRLNMEAYGEHLTHKDMMSLSLSSLQLEATAEALDEACGYLPHLSDNAKEIIAALGGVKIDFTGSVEMMSHQAEAQGVIATELGGLELDGAVSWQGRRINCEGNVSTEGFNAGQLLGNEKLGVVALTASGNAEIEGKEVNGQADVEIPEMIFNGRAISGITAVVIKNGADMSGHLIIADDTADAMIDAHMVLAGADTQLEATVDIADFTPSAWGLLPKYSHYVAKGKVDVSSTGNDLSNLRGALSLSNLSFERKDSPGLHLKSLKVEAEPVHDGTSVYRLKSDLIDGTLRGHFNLKRLPGDLKWMISECVPALTNKVERLEAEHGSYAQLDLTLKPDEELVEFFRLPVSPLVPVDITGALNTSHGAASLSVNVPYLRQGKNKLVRDTWLTAELDATSGVTAMKASTIFPAKKGDLQLDLGLYGKYNDIMTDVTLHSVTGPKVDGKLGLDFKLSRGITLRQPEVNLDILASKLNIGNAEWHIAPGGLTYANGVVDIKGIRASHDHQLVDISGVASSSPKDSVYVRLEDFNLDYLFETLNINYVAFGGNASGEIVGSALFSKAPVARTNRLYVESLSYNGSVLGNGNISSHWDNAAKEITINADIREKGRRTATVDGGIWVTRDSLSFDLNANKVNIGFLKPFMSAFSSDIRGRASGQLKLYGTFSDIDLVGKAFADSIAMKVDYTNVYYSGSDSVYIHPGRIEVPGFTLHDRYGNTARLTGEVKHRYFHDPTFTFRVTNAQHLLCYDTDAKINPDWYGRIFGSGGGVIRGLPGLVAIDIDMTTTRNSTFTFVLSDMQAVDDYPFLTFSDKRKEAQMRADTVGAKVDFVSLFKKKIEEQASRPSVFKLGIRATVTPQAQLNIIMDPVGGDKITAYGSGAMQIDYDSESDNMLMYGRYVCDEGTYNFTLQDLILKDFTIQPGSTISFNGDPLNADLNITAAYRVNTNLSELDKSFSTDRDLNRTNVPVDALLKVNGEMTHPDISFDIALPTLTEDVERKVKSIISTDDMMNRQIIYLLALNRFYTPEYMGGTGNGNELVSMASSTISSQLSNMLGQLTDKVSLAPSFRSDRGDFSDLEVDVALSSRLLNNRLLINGNFGYRDRSTSSTTFIGDFDIEYLLSRSGNLRLKAYNHFNDQNYYLRSALTTQGIGVVYRRDFNNPFTFLKRRKKLQNIDNDSPIEGETLPAPSDSIKSE